MGMLARLADHLRKKPGTAKTLSAIAVGMVELQGRMHAQLFGSSSLFVLLEAMLRKAENHEARA